MNQNDFTKIKIYLIIKDIINYTFYKILDTKKGYSFNDFTDGFVGKRYLQFVWLCIYVVP